MKMAGISPFLVLMAWIMVSCQAEMMELTHVLNPKSVHWPTFPDFRMKLWENGTKPDGLWVYNNELTFHEHTGTHVDSPAHTWLGGIYLHQVQLKNLIGPCVVIDVIEKVKADPDYRLVVQDVHDFEKQFGRIPEKAFVFMNTDGSKDYWDQNAYMGSSNTSDLSSLHFPAFDGPVVTWLIDNRNIIGVGVDRVSIDTAQNPGGKAHKALLSRGKIAIENLANVGKIPQSGTTVIVMPMLVENGSGAPARVVAFWGNDVQIPIDNGSTTHRLGSFGSCLFALVLFVLIV